MVDVGRDNGTACGHFVTDKFRGDVIRQAGTKAFARMLVAQRLATNALAAHVFADGDKLHLRRHYPLAGVVQLGHAFTRSCTLRREQPGEAQLVQTVIGQALPGVSRALLVQGFAVITGFYPRLAKLGQTLLDVNRYIRIAVRAGGVVDRHRFVLFKLRVLFAAADQGRAELDLAHRHADILLRTCQIDAFRVRESGAFQGIDKVLGVCALFAAGHFCGRHSSFQ